MFSLESSNNLNESMCDIRLKINVWCAMALMRIFYKAVAVHLVAVSYKRKFNTFSQCSLTHLVLFWSILLSIRLVFQLFTFDKKKGGGEDLWVIVMESLSLSSVCSLRIAGWPTYQSFSRMHSSHCIVSETHCLLVNFLSLCCSLLPLLLQDISWFSLLAEVASYLA